MSDATNEAGPRPRGADLFAKLDGEELLVGEDAPLAGLRGLPG